MTEQKYFKCDSPACPVQHCTNETDPTGYNCQTVVIKMSSVAESVKDWCASFCPSLESPNCCFFWKTATTVIDAVLVEVGLLSTKQNHFYTTCTGPLDHLVPQCRMHARSIIWTKSITWWTGEAFLAYAVIFLPKVFCIPWMQVRRFVRKLNNFFVRNQSFALDL